MQMLNNDWGARPRCVFHSAGANGDVTPGDGEGGKWTVGHSQRKGAICICGAAKLWMMHSKERAQGSFIERASHICHTSHRLSHDRCRLPYSCCLVWRYHYLIHRQDQDDRLMRQSKRFNKFPLTLAAIRNSMKYGANNQQAWWEYMWSAANVANASTLAPWLLIKSAGSSTKWGWFSLVNLIAKCPSQIVMLADDRSRLLRAQHKQHSWPFLEKRLSAAFVWANTFSLAFLIGTGTCLKAPIWNPFFFFYIIVTTAGCPSLLAKEQLFFCLHDN